MENVCVFGDLTDVIFLSALTDVGSFVVGALVRFAKGATGIFAFFAVAFVESTTRAVQLGLYRLECVLKFLLRECCSSDGDILHMQQRERFAFRFRIENALPERAEPLSLRARCGGDCVFVSRVRRGEGGVRSSCSEPRSYLLVVVSRYLLEKYAFHTLILCDRVFRSRVQSRARSQHLRVYAFERFDSLFQRVHHCDQAKKDNKRRRKKEKGTQI